MDKISKIWIVCKKARYEKLAGWARWVNEQDVYELCEQDKQNKYVKQSEEDKEKGRVSRKSEYRKGDG